MGLFTDYLLREATQDYQAIALLLARTGQAKYTGNGVWKVTTLSYTFEDGRWQPSESRAEWFCFESTQKVVPANGAAQITLLFLKTPPKTPPPIITPPIR
jgi:hypothetical protein